MLLSDDTFVIVLIQYVSVSEKYLYSFVMLDTTWPKVCGHLFITPQSVLEHGLPNPWPSLWIWSPLFAAITTYSLLGRLSTTFCNVAVGICVEQGPSFWVRRQDMQSEFQLIPKVLRVEVRALCSSFMFLCTILGMSLWSLYSLYSQNQSHSR